jgi:hypothetical protein
VPPPDEGVFVELAGRLVMAQFLKRYGQTIRGPECLAVIVTKPGAPLVVEAAGEVMAAAGVTAPEQVPDCTAGQVAQAGIAGCGGVSGEQVPE